MQGGGGGSVLGGGGQRCVAPRTLVAPLALAMDASLSHSLAASALARGLTWPSPPTWNSTL
jgi:hypothetical protein